MNGTSFQRIQEDRVRITATQILRYLERHPDAMDTAEGIARWWVGEDLATVQSALAMLTDRDLVSGRLLMGRLYFFLGEAFQGKTLLMWFGWFGQVPFSADPIRGGGA